ncbi:MULTISPECIES: hypothetical protein [unclassified Streptomyces]|uniref:hypothetical protein n=1 Tax=unclassified Streptomyces TaxID=2593676 RepID=UPI0036E850A8
MTTVHTLMLAGELDDLGDSWITMFQDWATKGLQAGLLVITGYLATLLVLSTKIAAQRLTAVMTGWETSRAIT